MVLYIWMNRRCTQGVPEFDDNQLGFQWFEEKFDDVTCLYGNYEKSKSALLWTTWPRARCPFVWTLIRTARL